MTTQTITFPAPPDGWGKITWRFDSTGRSQYFDQKTGEWKSAEPGMFDGWQVNVTILPANGSAHD